MTGRDRERMDRLLHLLEQAEPCPRRAPGWRRLVLESLISGIFRGLGFTLGVALLGALAAALVRSMVIENIPLIGGFLAEVIHAIQAKM